MNAKSIILLLLLLGATLSCDDAEKDAQIKQLQEEVAALKTENTNLKSGEKKMQASVDEYNKFLSEIEKNLAEIDKSKEMVAKLNAEGKDRKEVAGSIREHIVNIRTLMENSRLKVLALDRSLNQLRKESAGKSEEILGLDRKVKSLTQDLLAKDDEIEALDDKLAEMEGLYELEAQNVAELKAIIDRAYYIVKSEKELKEMGIVTKEGGFIGIGRVKVINANATDAAFTQIKKSETKEFAVSNKKPKLISIHPEGSYEWVEQEGVIEKLKITDAQSFWKNGNYLVIQGE